MFVLSKFRHFTFQVIERRLPSSDFCLKRGYIRTPETPVYVTMFEDWKSLCSAVGICSIVLPYYLMLNNQWGFITYIFYVIN